MQLEIQKYLFDMQTSINSINEYLEGKRDFDHYQSNKLLRRGIESELEIIGEEASRILKYLLLPEVLEGSITQGRVHLRRIRSRPQRKPEKINGRLSED